MSSEYVATEGDPARCIIRKDPIFSIMTMACSSACVNLLLDAAGAGTSGLIALTVVNGGYRSK